MDVTADVAILGLGAMGASALYYCTKAGLNVVGIEQYTIGHNKGSSHGETRIIRKAYFEHPSYVPLLNRSYDLYRDYEQETGEKVLHITGGVDIGLPDSEMVLGSRLACETYNLEHEILNADEMKHQFPGLNIPPSYVGVFQKDGGVLEPEKWITGVVRAAEKTDNCRVFTETTIVDVTYNPASDVFVISTQSGDGTSSQVISKKIVVATGPWIQHHTWSIFAPNHVPPALQWVRSQLETERQVINWHRVKADCTDYSLSTFPIFLIAHELEHATADTAVEKPDVQQTDNTSANHGAVEASKTKNILQERTHFYYGFPQLGDEGVKIGKYNHLYQNIQQDDLHTLPITVEDVFATSRCVKFFLNDTMELPEWYDAADAAFMNGMKLPQDVDITSNVNKSIPCTFNNTPDGHFVIHPYRYGHPTHSDVSDMDMPSSNNRNIIFIAACAGHGFKFSSVIGEIIKDLALSVDRPDIEWLSANRFNNNISQQ